MRGDRHAPSVLAELLTPSDELKPMGRWVPLVEVIAAATDPSQQLELTRSYWKLTAALAQYRVAWDEYRLLEAVREGTGNRQPSPDDRLQAQVRADSRRHNWKKRPKNC